jgi:predicted metalloendopeptidase
MLVLAFLRCGGKAPAPPARAAVTSGIDSSGVDRTVRPQDDFFQHVNGAWLASVDIPADKPSWGVFDMLVDKAQADLRAIVERAAASNGQAGSDAQKIGDFYRSFMDEARIEELGLKPVEGELAAIERLRTKADLARYFARMMKLNLINPLAGTVEGDAQDPGREILYVYQGGLGLPDRDYYFREDATLAGYRDKYVAFLATLLALAGEASPSRAANDVLRLETELARAHWTNVESRDRVKTYNRRNLSDLPGEFPGFDWRAWTSELGVAEAPALVVAQPSYARALAAAVDRWPVDRWKPYLKASLLNGFAPFLHRPLLEVEFGFYGATLRGLKENEPRWKRAIGAINGGLGEMLGRLYVERHFKPEAKARMEQLVENLRTAFREGIDRLEWMSPDTRGQAREKLARFRAKVGYPATWRDYSRVQVLADDLVGNLTRAFLAESEHRLGRVGRPVDPERWAMTPQTVNAYYNPVRNEIVFPAAILQPPFFDLEADDAANYGAIGAIIGHEMGHGFDDQGRRFDAAGALRDWWAPHDAGEYVRRATRLVEQYARFEPLPGLRVNGELTLGENIGDLTGIVLAYRAYKLALQGKPAPVIDGLSGDQRFFFAWAQAWRGKQRDEALRQQVLTNPHSPERYRANGPLRNMPEFYAAFGVQPGEGMFLPPEERTAIW